MKKTLCATLFCFTLLGTGCQSNNVIQTQTLDTQQEIILGYAFRNMAWDGNELWQVVQEENQKLLVAQNPFTQKSRAIELKDKLPIHKSLTFGQDHFWLLDQAHTLHQLHPSGELVKSLELELPTANGAEQIIWAEDQLWLLHKAFISKENTQEKARFYQLNPETGAIIQTLAIDDESFSDFPHLNLAVSPEDFYVVAGNVFVQNKNLVYRISRETGAVRAVRIDRVVTGVSTSFYYQDTLYGVELLELDRNCGASCKGQLQAFPLPDTP